MSPGHGANVFGSSALMRHSIAWPRKLHGRVSGRSSFSPAAARICSATRSSAGHHLGHRVLDLHARVHLQEVELAVLVHEELERAERRVAGLADRLADHLAHLLAQLGGHRGARRLLDHLLVAALERALALAERPHAAVLVGEDLELDVPRPLDELLQVDVGVLEARPRPRASRCPKARATSASSRTMRMPRPPPPPDAFRMTGKPMRFASSIACVGVARGRRCPGGAAGRSASAFARAVTLSPQARIASGVGPMNVRPHFSQSAANSAFSERKP